MPWQSITLVPGANVEETPTKNQAGYVLTRNGRFKQGLFQKLGGWLKYLPIVFPGGISSLWGWLDLNARVWLSIATGDQITVVNNGQPQPITPRHLFTGPAPDFSTVAGSTEVEIVDADLTDPLTTNVVVNFLSPVSVGGIILSGTYPISSITGANSYTIEAFSPATATVNNGGAVPVFDTTAGSSDVEVTLADHGLVVGNIFVIADEVFFTDFTLDGRYTVTGISSANVFTISAPVASSVTETVPMSNGDAHFEYFIAIGPSPTGVGYGLGGYGTGGYGKGTSPAVVAQGDPLTAASYTQDNWGEILLVCLGDGGIFYWRPGSGFQNLALIPDGPLYNTGMFVSMAQQQVIAYGTSVDARLGGGIGIYQDPMLIAWCDIGDFFNWTPAVSNFARNYRVPTGSRIVSGAASKNRNLIWTDLDLHAGTFNGGQSVYSWNRVGSNCGLVGLHAWAQQADTVYWMGTGNFFRYAGSGVEVIPCTVWDAVFQELPSDLAPFVVCASNSDFNEIWWFYTVPDPNDEFGSIEKYVKYNTVEGTWDNGLMDRTAWLDRSVLGNPIGANSDGLVYSHENGFNDDGVPLVPMFETGDFYIAEGEEFVFIDEVFPDFKWGFSSAAENAQINITLLCRDYPGETQRAYGPFVCSKSTPSFIPSNPDGTRVRTRQCALRVQSNDMNSFWRLGKIRFRYAPDGRR